MDDVHDYLDMDEVISTKGENLVMLNDKSSNVIIFSCESNLKFMCSVEIILVDGTFDYCTKFFQQMFTVIGFKNNKYVPVALSLLKDKKEFSYRTVMSTLKNKCLEMNLIFKPQHIVSDFEKGILQAAIKEFPNTTLVGCRFHLSQAWWRKIMGLGLTIEYKNKNSEIGKWLHYVFGLTFLHPDEVENVFLELIAEQPIDPRVTEFSDYLVDNYIDSDATFPTTLWAALNNNCWRTNNGSEAFNSKFKTENQSPHPNIFEFLKCIKNIQIDTYTKINSVDLENNKKSESISQKFIKNKIKQYLNKEIDSLTFVKSVSYKYEPL